MITFASQNDSLLFFIGGELKTPEHKQVFLNMVKAEPLFELLTTVDRGDFKCQVHTFIIQVIIFCLS